MTIQEYIIKLEKKNIDLNKELGRIFYLAVQGTHSEMSERIFIRGENVKGKTFQYSTKGAIISDVNSPIKFVVIPEKKDKVKKSEKKDKAKKSEKKDKAKKSEKKDKAKKSEKKDKAKKSEKKEDLNRFQPIKQPSKNGKKGYYGRYFAGGYKEFRNFVGRKSDHVNFDLTGELKMDFNNGSTATPEKVNDFEYVIRLNRLRNIGLRGHLDVKYNKVFVISSKEREVFYKDFDTEIALFLAK